MTIESLFTGWLPLVGGVTGLAMLTYMVLMVYYNHKKDRDIQALRLEFAELKGILLERKRVQR